MKKIILLSLLMFNVAFSKMILLSEENIMDKKGNLNSTLYTYCKDGFVFSFMKFYFQDSSPLLELQTIRSECSMKQ